MKICIKSLNDLNIAIYSNNNSLLPFSMIKEQIIKYIEYIDLNGLRNVYSNITKDEIYELQLLQEIIGRKNFISYSCEVKGGKENTILYKKYKEV